MAPSSSGFGVALLLLINYSVFALDRVVMSLHTLPLVVAKWQWWQFVSYSFCHANFEHLVSNMFMLYVFGKSVEEDEGTLGVIFTYLFCAAGAGVLFVLTNPRGVLVGASGAVFGLFVVSMVSKMQLNFRKLLELLAVTPFVYSQIMSNVSAQIGGGASNVAYIAHLGGAAGGLLLVTLLSLLPADD